MPRSGDLNGVICRYNCFICKLVIYLHVQPLYLQIYIFICKFTLFAKLFSTQKKRHIHGTFYNTPENSRAKDSFDLSANPRL